MNEKIRELGKQVGFYVENTHSGGFPNENLLAIEKFAELIIEECASLFPLTFTDEKYQRRIDKTIRKHFGLADTDIETSIRNRSTYYGNDT